MWRTTACIFSLAGLAPLIAQEAHPLKAAPLFSDGAVLQRDQPIPIWGEAKPGAELQIKFRAQSVRTKADAEGKWATNLEAEAAGGPDALTIETPGNSLTVNDVLVGEVWLAAGQSNMLFKVNAMRPQQTPVEIPADPKFRIYRVPQNPSDTPLPTMAGGWRALSPEASAVAYYFGRQLRETLDVPVGIVTSAVGGTPIGAWISKPGASTIPVEQGAFEAEWNESMAKYPASRKTYEEALAAWEQKKKDTEAAGSAFSEARPKEPLGPDSPKRPYGLFNGMIHPLAPYAIRGILWYQGESDTRRERAVKYAAMLRALISDWRGRWHDPKLPFLIIQLPTYEQDIDWVTIREAQQTVARDPGNGLVVTMDVGEEKNVHPVNKEPVGRRAGNLALADIYGRKVPAHSPTARSAKRESESVRIAFNLEEGASLACRPESEPPGLELAGADGTFFPALVRREQNSLLVSSDRVPDPVRVRYAWSGWTPVSIFDSNGLPAPQFSLPVEKASPEK